MGRARDFLLLLLLATAIVSLSRDPQAAAATPTLSPTVDQSFTSPTNLYGNINEGDRFIAQTFTAGLTGNLAGVNIHVESSSEFLLHVAIRAVTGGVPSSTVLGETTLSSSSAPLSLFITFPQPVNIVTGVQYAIVVNYEGAPPPGPGQVQGFWMGAIGDLYTGGDVYASYLDGISWSWFQGDDLHFRTYVDVPDVPVGGIAELADVSDSSGHNYVALAGGLAAAALALTAGTWYARRRWGG